MLLKIALIPAVAAAFALAACQPKVSEAPGNDVNAAATNTVVETGNTAVVTNTAVETGNNAAATNAAATSNSAAPQSAGYGAPKGTTCGGIIGKQCPSAMQFCKLPDGQCKVADAQGTCTTKPQICPKIFKPVCGCNGKTYGNACEASAAGVSVQSQGHCPKS
jgi:hypothetical protein